MHYYDPMNSPFVNSYAHLFKNVEQEVEKKSIVFIPTYFTVSYVTITGFTTPN